MTPDQPDPRRATLGKLLRFLLVGGGFSLGYALVTAVLIGPVGLPPFTTSVAVYALCIPAAFYLQKRVTFRVDRTGRTGFLIYAATQVGSLAIVAAITTRFVTETVAIDTLIFLATAGSAAVLSFAISNRFAFRPRG